MSVLGSGFRAHGLPACLLLEGGISASTNIATGARALGIRIRRATGPHQKVAEIVFDSLWADLSALRGHVGRDRGQYPQIDALYQRCLTGTADPAEHFPYIGELGSAVAKAVERWNTHVIRSRYGEWVPADAWRGAVLRPLPPGWEALWAPRVAELTVRGLMLRTTTQAADGWAAVYTYCGECLADWQGARVRLHHDPRSDAPAIVSLARPARGRPEGHIIGRVELVDRATKWTLAALGYIPGALDDKGARVAQAQAWLYRQVRAVRGRRDGHDIARRPSEADADSITINRLRPIQPEPVSFEDPRLLDFEVER
jgi:hypothetical protein